MNRGLLEHLAEPAMNRCLFGFLCIEKVGIIGGTVSYKKKCKLIYSPVKKYRDIHKNLVEKDLLYIYSPDTNKIDVFFTQ